MLKITNFKNSDKQGHEVWISKLLIYVVSSSHTKHGQGGISHRGTFCRLQRNQLLLLLKDLLYLRCSSCVCCAIVRNQILLNIY